MGPKSVSPLVHKSFRPLVLSPTLINFGQLYALLFTANSSGEACLFALLGLSGLFGSGLFDGALLCASRLETARRKTPCAYR